MRGFRKVGLRLAVATAVVAASPAGAGELDVAALERTIAKAVTDKQLVGLSVGVLHEGRVVIAKGYGLASVARQQPVTPETAFAIGSVTKQFTCAAFLMLAEEGRLLPSTPVAAFYPSLTRAASVTLLDLGNNVSGYRDYYPLDFVDRPMAKPRPPDEIIAQYGSLPLDFETGSRYSYSNTGFMILGRALERASGEPLSRLLQRRVFSPLGMTHTRFAPARGAAGLAEGYSPLGLGNLVPATPEGDGWLGAAGGLWSTPSDLLAWDLALAEGKLLSAASYRTLTTPRVLRDGRSTGYGCGLGVRDRGASLVLTHGGAVSGFVARNTLIPATRSAIVLLANSDFAAIGELHDALLEALTPRSEAPVVAPPARDVASALLAELREGRLERARLGEEYSALMTAERVRALSESLRAAGEPKDLRLESTHERGGMEVAILRFSLGGVESEAQLYRSPDGTVHEFLFYRR